MTKHILTRQIGNLKGFSTSSIFMRPSNVADRAINIQKAPDETLQLRRGYQCQIAQIGGMGLGTFDDPAADLVKTVTVSVDGFVYNKLVKQIYFYYDGRVTGEITDITTTNPAVVEDVGHGLQTGATLIIRDVTGMTEVNNQTFTITVLDADHYELDGIDATGYTPYISGGYWSIAFADQRYLTFTIFTDPRYLVTNPGWSIGPWSFTPWGSPSGESITANITVNRAAQIDGNQSNINTFNVEFGHELAASDVIQFVSSNGIQNQRTVISVTPTSITFGGNPVSVLNGTYVNQFFDIPFRKGFDVSSPYLISTFISTITNPTTGIFGLQVAINGDDTYPAAFLQIFEPVIIDSNREYTIDYWYWEQINTTIGGLTPLPGTANPNWQNSPEFEIASMDVFDDVIYIVNGWDYPQKYDGQTLYRAGMPEGARATQTANTTYVSKPFLTTERYQYATTYEQIDHVGHIVEGVISEINNHTIVAATEATNVILTDLQSSQGNNWNTNGAVATGASSTTYGPDANDYFYDLVPVNSGYTLKIGDSAYYGDVTAAVMNTPQTGIVLNVDAGHAAIPGDVVYFIDAANVTKRRIIVSTTATTVTINGEPVTVDPTIDPAHANMLIYKVSRVFGNVAIVDGTQNDVNTINVKSNYPNPSSDPTIQLGDIVSFVDSSGNVQRRTVTAVTATSVTVDGIPVSVINLILIFSENQRANAITLQRLNLNAATLATNAPISNNLRINIYRTQKNEVFGTNGKLWLIASIPNDSSVGVQTYIDAISDAERGPAFANPTNLPNPPPISKYVKSFGNQMFYAGGERGKPENSDRVFFSAGNNPESVSLASDSFNVPNVADDITGIGVAGTTLIVGKNQSLWGVTGNFLTGDIEVIQIARGSNIGIAAHASIASVGTLMYFLDTSGVYAITENQIFPTDQDGNPIALSKDIQVLFREKTFLPQTKFVFKRAVASNYQQDLQYWLFIPCEDTQTTIRTANAYSQVLCYDYEGKNWFQWFNVNAAGGIVVIDDDIYFQERRFSGVDGNTANLYKQHRFYRLIDHADHAGPQRIEWLSSWEDLGEPEVRKKFSHCVLLMDRVSDLYQYNSPQMYFSSYLDRLPNLQSTKVQVTQVDNIRNSSWSYSAWGWGYWSGYQDSFVRINLKQGTVAKSIQVGFVMQGINMDIRLAGFQLEAIPENRRTITR